MKLTNNNKGFTLIELIMVIVILGILSAVVVPKFFDFTGKAHSESEKAVIGNIKAGLQLFATNELITGNARSFPKGDEIDTEDEITGVTGSNAILDEWPDGWTIASGANANEAKFTSPNSVVYTYTCTGADNVKFTITP